MDQKVKNDATHYLELVFEENNGKKKATETLAFPHALSILWTKFDMVSEIFMA